MKAKKGAVLAGLQIEMRPALIGAEKVWKEYGRKEGVTITCGLDGIHSAGSLHYYGYAVDLRTWWWRWKKKTEIAQVLQLRLGDDFDVVVEKTHIHLEYDPNYTMPEV